MTTTTIKTVLFAGLFAALLIPFMGQQEAEAAMSTPVFEGVDSGVIITWGGSIAHNASGAIYGHQLNLCGESFTTSGFYSNTSNQRGASHAVPAQISAVCNFDNDLSGYFELTLKKVEYTLTGDGNTTITRHDMGASSAGYKMWSDGTSNTGLEYITVKYTYEHTQ